MLLRGSFVAACTPTKDRRNGIKRIFHGAHGAPYGLEYSRVIQAQEREILFLAPMLMRGSPVAVCIPTEVRGNEIERLKKLYVI